MAAVSSPQPKRKARALAASAAAKTGILAPAAISSPWSSARRSSPISPQRAVVVVFFCGAGVSYPAGLPCFKGLVEQIYQWNGTTLKDIERKAFDRKQYDATLDLLEQHLSRVNPLGRPTSLLPDSWGYSLRQTIQHWRGGKKIEAPAAP